MGVAGAPGPNMARPNFSSTAIPAGPGDLCARRRKCTMSKSDKRPIIKLKSTAGTGFTYVTRKNKTNTRERIELRKYDPKVRQHVIFKEER